MASAGAEMSQDGVRGSGNVSRWRPRPLELASLLYRTARTFAVVEILWSLAISTET